MDTPPRLDDEYSGPLPAATVAGLIEKAAIRRAVRAQAFVQKINDVAGNPGATLGGFCRRGARYDYRERKAFISRQVLGLGSERLVSFILAHEVGHATQVIAKRRALLTEQVLTIGLTFWVALAHLGVLPKELNSGGLFATAWSCTVVWLSALDVWWEIDADRKARQWTGFSGKLSEVFDEFLAVESTTRTNWQAKIRSFAADVTWGRGFRKT